MKVCNFALRFIMHSLNFKQVFEQVNPVLEKVLLDVVVPLVQLSPVDERLWQEDPIEYVHRQEDFVSLSSPRFAAADLIEVICKKSDPNGDSYLTKLINYAAVFLQNGVDPRTGEKLDIARKEGLLFVFGHLKDLILKNKTLSLQTEGMLERFIIPEFNNELGFLRARACYVFAKYGSID